MALKAAFIVMALAAALYATVVVVDGTVKYVAEIKNYTLYLPNATVEIPRVRYSWEFNNTYTVFGVHYSDPSCVIGQYNMPRFYIQCTVGTDIVVVAVKDPKAKVECKTRRGPLQPQYATEYVEIFKTRDLGIECESGYPAAVSAPSALIGILAGITAASAALLFALGVLLLRSTLLK